ncbi:hypothetical protein [Planctomycetes bacterium Pan216]
MKRHAHCRTVGYLAVLTLVIGCQQSKIEGEVPVFPVTGTMLANGKPATGAMITLHTIDTTTAHYFPRATAGEDGTFRLSTFVSDDGAPTGEFVVTIRWPDPKVVAQDPLGEREEAPPDLLKRKVLLATDVELATDRPGVRHPTGTGRPFGQESSVEDGILVHREFRVTMTKGGDIVATILCESVDD